MQLSWKVYQAARDVTAAPKDYQADLLAQHILCSNTSLFTANSKEIIVIVVKSL